MNENWFNSLYAELFWGNIKKTISFSIISQQWDGRVSLNPSCGWREHVYHKWMTDDDLTMQGARASVAMGTRGPSQYKDTMFWCKNSIVKIRWSHDHLSFYSGKFIPGKTMFILRSGSLRKLRPQYHRDSEYDFKIHISVWLQEHCCWKWNERGVPGYLIYGKSTLDQVMAWCHQHQAITWSNVDSDLWHPTENWQPAITEMKMSFWQLPMQPVMKMVAKWWHLLSSNSN